MVGDVYGGYRVLQQSSVSMVGVVVFEKIDYGRWLGLWALSFSGELLEMRIPICLPVLCSSYQDKVLHYLSLIRV